MSMVPLFFRDWWDGDFDRERPSRLWDQHFGMGMKRDDLLKNFNDLSALRSGRYLRPWGAEPLARSSSGSSNLKVDDKSFQVILDVQQFAPEEITVKISDGYIVVEGKHNEKKDEHGLVSRQFTRRYTCPKDSDFDKISSHLSSDGVLTVTIPKKIEGGAGERYVQIVQTNTPAITPTAAETVRTTEAPKASSNETHIKIQQEGQ